MYGRIYREVLFPLYERTLRRRRTLDHLDALERSQWLSEAEIRERSWRALLELLRHAERHVPYYRRRFAEYGVSAARVRSPEDFARFPVLTKDDIRRSAGELIAETHRGRRLVESSTGGSTGRPLRFVYDHAVYQRRIAAAHRADRWAGALWGERELHVWGVATRQEPIVHRAKQHLQRALLRRRVLSTFDLRLDALSRVVDDYQRFRPRVVIGYVTPLFHIARFLLERGVLVEPPRGIITSAERLFPHQREAIERAFGARVFDRYGCREVMLIACECDRHEGLHVNAENVHVELLRGDRPAPPGERGEVVITDLYNLAMPLVRYKNEDVAFASPVACSCGRGLPLFGGVEGRVLDLIVTHDGRLVAGELFPHMLRDFPGIEQFQVHQGRSREITLRVVAGPDFDHGSIPRIEREARQFLGASTPFRVLVVDDIPRTAAGKHRVTTSEVPVDLARCARLT